MTGRVQEVAVVEQVIIAVDPAKRLHAVNVVNARSEVIARRTFANSSAGSASCCDSVTGGGTVNGPSRDAAALERTSRNGWWRRASR
jgi:hypothetical protein